MTKTLLSFFLLINLSFASAQNEQLLERQGEVTFFSYTSVENIQAKNNQVQSFLIPNKNEVVVLILMKAFKFKKSLMHEHFNESYIESDIYPEATFEGKIIDFDPKSNGSQTKIIKGDFTLRNITKPIEIKSKISKLGDNKYTIEGCLLYTSPSPRDS